MVRKLCIAAFLVLAINGRALAVPYSYTIDNFSILKNGASLFDDPFDDGNPPPSAPNLSNGNPITYAMAGTMGPEDTGAPGRLTIDQSGAVPAINPAGVVEIFQRAMLETNRQDVSVSQLGLKSDDTFSISGIFDIASLPSQEGDQFGIRIEDFGPSAQAGDDVLALRVLFIGGNLVISFARLDFIGHSVNPIAGALFLPNAGDDQIELTLAKLSATSDAITASFTFIDGGTPGPTTTFGPTADIFNGETYTRAGFYARRVEVPEPSTLAMLGFGLVMLVVIGRPAGGARRFF